MLRIATAGALVLGLLAVAGCSGDEADGPIRVSGHIEATEVRVSTKIPGTLKTLETDEGDRLDPGAVIGRIDTVDLELALRAAEAERDAAQADLRLKRAGYRSEEIAEAAAQQAAVQAELEQAQRELDRAQGLLDAGSGTAKLRDDALARRDVAAARLRAAGETLRKLRAGFRSEEIAAAKARLDGAEARMAQLRQNIDDATIVSPLRGVVTEKIAEAGELLPAGSLIVVVTDLDSPWLTVYVPEPALPSVKIGQPVRVETDDGGTHEGHVTFIASDAEFTPKNVQTRDERVKLVFRVKVGLDNEDGTFKPGMPAVAVFDRGGGAAAGSASNDKEAS